MIEPGFILNERYKLIKTLGEGGMANVYLAHDLILDRDVAVKVLRLDLQNDPDAARRFQREAMATSELVHPNIVSIYDVGESHGQQYLVMEYVEGTDLKKYIVEHFPIPYQRVIDIMSQILAAVQVAHDHNIIHRDLKPQNVLIDTEGNAKITDFGIAVALADNSMTQTNSMLGSVHYLSPEQARGGMPTRQSDIYALGIILFEMLTGTVPFEGESAVSIALKHFQADMPSVRSFDPRIPQAMENVVLKATAKNPLNRYTSADAMASDLKTSLSPARAHEAKYVVPTDDDLDETKVIPNTAESATTETSPAPTQKDAATPAKKPSRRAKLKRRLPFILAGIAAALIIGFIVVAFAGGRSDVAVPDLRGMTTAQADNALDNANLKLGTIKHASSAKVAKNRIIRSDPRQATSVKKDSKVNIVLSKGAAKYTLADYTGDQYKDTAKKLRKAGFTVRQVKTASETAAKGEILKQDYAAGKRVVPANTTITFTVSTGSNEFQLEDMVGGNFSLAAARTYAKQVGLNLTVSEGYSADVPKGNVMRQNPAGGAMVKRGDTVAITVSRGDTPNAPSSSSSSQSTNAPSTQLQDLRGLTQSDAESYAAAHGLKVSIAHGYSNNYGAGQVMAQSPGSGSSAKSGDSITLTISQGSAPSSASSASSSS